MPSFVEIPLLRVAYEVTGPLDGFPVVLNHGWPDDVRTWDLVLSPLHRAGYRTYVPWLRLWPDPVCTRRYLSQRAARRAGTGSCRFRDCAWPWAACAGGPRWGARASYIASALNESQVVACVALSVGYGTNHPGQVLSYRQTQNYWYHWLLATARGERLAREDRRAFTRHIWNEWFVAYKPDDAEFERTAEAFENPDGQTSPCTRTGRAGATQRATRGMPSWKPASIPCQSSACPR